MTTSRRCSGCVVRTILPDTSFETSSRSSTRRARCRVWRTMIPRRGAVLSWGSRPSVQYVNRRGDRAEGIAQLVAEHRDELVLGSIRRLHAFKMEGQDLFVLAAQSLGDLQEEPVADLRMGVGEPAERLTPDLQDHARLARPDGGGARPALEEAHLPERLAAPHDRQRDRWIAVDGQQRFGRPGPDHEDRIADLALPEDHRPGLVRVLARSLVGDEPPASLLVLRGDEGVVPEEFDPVERLHGPPLFQGLCAPVDRRPAPGA